MQYFEHSPVMFCLFLHLTRSDHLLVVLLQVNELQTELSKQQNQVVSLQMEQKELKKKQRRSERYYSNKASKDSDPLKDSASNEGDEVEAEDGDEEELNEATQGWSSLR